MTHIDQFEGHNKPIRSLAFSADGVRPMTGSRDNTARVFKDVYPIFYKYAMATAVDLGLDAGVNALVFEVVQDEQPSWKGSIRFTDAEASLSQASA